MMSLLNYLSSSRLVQYWLSLVIGLEWNQYWTRYFGIWQLLGLWLAQALAEEIAVHIMKLTVLRLRLLLARYNKWIRMLVTGLVLVLVIVVARNQFKEIKIEEIKLAARALSRSRLFLIFLIGLACFFDHRHLWRGWRLFPSQWTARDNIAVDRLDITGFW